MMAIIASPFIGTVGAATVEIVEHTEGGLVSGFWKLEVTVSGPALGVRISVNGGNASNLEDDSGGLYTTTLSTSTFPDGAHEVVVEVYDSSGGTDQATISLEVDNTPPEMTVQWPNEAILMHPFRVNVTFSDAHPDGSSAWVEVNGTNRTFPLGSVPGGFAGAIDITALDNGTAMFTVVAVDGAGNLVHSDPKTLEVRRLPDLALTDYTFGHMHPQGAPGTYHVLFTVVNRGSSEVDGFDVALFGNDELMERRHLNVSLSMNASWNGTLDWWVEDAGVYNITLVLDPDDVIEETDETNNERRDRQSFGGSVSCLSTMAVIAVPMASCMVFGHHRSMRQAMKNRGQNAI